MKTSIRIKAPSKWRENYIVEALKDNGVVANYTQRVIDPNTEILVTNYLSNDDLRKLPNLRALIIPTSGTEEIELEKVKERGISIYQDKSVISKGVIQYFLDNIRKLAGTTLEEYFDKKNVGLLGFGNIGKEIYSALSDYNCKFWILKETPLNPLEKVAHSGGLEGLEKVFMSCDVIINTLPLSEATKSIGLNKTGIIKPNSVVVNLSRTGILEEKEIFERVKNGTLGGAIFDTYPNDLDLESYKNVENLILTPHTAAIYGNNLEKIALSIKNQISLCS